LGATADDVGARGPSPPRPSVVFGAARVASAGSQAFTYARIRPCWTGTFEDLIVSAAIGKFPSQFASPLAFLPPFLRSISSLLSVLPSFPKGGWWQSPRCLSSGFPKIAPPSVVPARVNSPLSGSLACARGLLAFGAGLCLRFRASRSCSDLAVWLRPRRFAPLADCQDVAPDADPGVQRVSARLQLSLPTRSPRCPCCPSKPCSLVRAANHTRVWTAAERHRCIVADAAFTAPLASSFLAEAGTSRLSSLTRAVLPCAVASAGEPLLPWACRSFPPPASARPKARCLAWIQHR